MYILLNKEGRVISRSDIKQNNFIEIEDEKIEEILKTNIYDYLFVNNEFIYKPIEVDLKKVLEKIKFEKREELKRIRAEKIDADLEVNGDSFQVRERDLQNFYNLKIAVDIDKTRANEKLSWVLADNSIKEFSYAELMGVLGAYIARKQEVFTRFGILKSMLDNCKTVEEVENIQWI